MGLQDRDYNRPRASDSVAFRLLFGDFVLGHFAGIRIRVHSSMILLIAFRLLFAPATGWRDAIASSVILFGVVLLHEFGHCFAARSVGGKGDDVLLWPLGGLAFINTPKRPWPSFVGTVGGPLANVIICVVCALLIRVLDGQWIAANPFAPFAASLNPNYAENFSDAVYYLWWIQSTSLSLLLFNLLPIYPLDGGHMFQCAMWPKLGFYRSMEIACIVGMAGSVIIGLLNFGNLWMMFLMFSCFMTCQQTKGNLRAFADEVYEEERYSGLSGAYTGNKHPDRDKIGLPRVSFGTKPRVTKPKDDRFTMRDLNPLEFFAKRKRRKQFEKLMRDD